MQSVIKWVTLFCFLGNCISTTSSNLPPEVYRPPKITRHPEAIVHVAEILSPVLRCEAEAVPEVIVPDGYNWTKNGELLSVITEVQTNDETVKGQAVMSTSDGSITFWQSGELSEEELNELAGEYRCYASNRYGTAISNKAIVRVATAQSNSPENQEKEVEEGQSLILSCNYDASFPHKIKWLIGDEDEVELSRRISQATDGSLVFSNVAATDDGLTVYCNAKNLVRRASTDGVHYTLRVTTGGSSSTNISPQIIYPNVEKRIVLRGEDIELTCIATGNPTPELQWTKLSGGWPNGRTVFKNNDHTVIIQDATMQDTGKYACGVANNDQDKKVVDIKVEAKPYFSKTAHHPNDVTKAPGDDVTIRCEPSGEPEPTIEWMVNGRPLDDYLDENRVVHDKSIRLNNLQNGTSAVYQCIATNIHGSLIQQGFVNVLTWEPVPRPGNNLIHSQVEGKSLNLKCKMFASPPPSITWTKDGSEITTGGRFNVTASVHLGIQRLVKADEGVYSCVAQNEYGSASLDFEVNVFVRTKLHLETDVVATRGKPMIFNATVETDPGISHSGNVIWSKAGREVGRGLSYQIPNVQFSNAGKYKAEIETSRDTAFNYFNVTVIDRPLPPPVFTFKEIDELNLEFNWTPGKHFGSPIIEYQIKFEENVYNPGAKQILRENIPGSARNVHVELSPGVNYRFEIFARNSVGWSNNGTATAARHKTPDSEPKIPTSLSATASSKPRFIDASWTPVKGVDRNGAGFGYRISYKPVAADSSAWIVRNITSGDQSSFEFEGDNPYQEYIITLTTFNDVGASLERELQATSYTGEDVPELPPTNVKVKIDKQMPTTVVVSWKPLEMSAVRGRLQGYLIRYSTDNFQSINHSVTTNDTSTNRKEVTDLEPETEYQFKVAACSGAGCEVFSEAMSKTTPRGIPLPGSINVTINATGARVVWTPSPISDGVAAETVQIEYIAKGGSQVLSTDTKDVADEGVEFFISLSHPNTQYTFRAVTTNIYGFDKSEEVTQASNGPDPSTAGVTTQIWFIVIMSLVGLLIIVLLIICVVRRKKGGKYPVAAKEQYHGDPQPLDEEAGDYIDEPDDVKRPLAPESSNGKPPPRTRGDSVGGDSIEAFVGADPKEFNEDGSFIGQYGVITSPSNGNTPATPPGDEQSVVHQTPGDAV